MTFKSRLQRLNEERNILLPLRPLWNPIDYKRSIKSSILNLNSTSIYYFKVSYFHRSGTIDWDQFKTSVYNEIYDYEGWKIIIIYRINQRIETFERYKLDQIYFNRIVNSDRTRNDA